ncbi:Lipid IVA 3-deoxy-D-manno-octulosonic acid transferase [Candidatus Rhodobacter oscarellae]|uniref:3-deoxy-D-manno-octulosonic acid transferase n=1 Tax=Candidatus Rhodobacter oscarellae TaxID=1675527 RepID=A0A0J9H1C1_9RHOB|nr:glycosyltransferase N-terminal domain-containing protein [Candidatus Rhodobacter lobularis]KMW59548.1 Lipid IVA 3-deoxy-D-manno-octulosonic acid transferase [Candidatus Rhodobacter lobularis]
MLGYRLFLVLAGPVVFMLLLWRLLRGRETLADIDQRLGGGTQTPAAIWVHGASNGELISARQLIEDIGTAFPGHSLVVTSNTISAREMVRGWGLGNVTPCLAPLDFRWALRRFRARCSTVALVTLENELWPNRLVTFQGPVISVAARMSDKSARRWSQFGGVMSALLARVDYLAPQDLASGARLKALGLADAALGPPVELKSSVTAETVTQAPPQILGSAFIPERTILAASTHPGEDEIVLDAFKQRLQEDGDLTLILAPRHPRRAEEIVRLCEARGLHVVRRSQMGELSTDVYLADTLGEMALWYRSAAVTIVCGSLVPLGGHTPFEPAAHGSALIHGPHVANFQDIYAELDDAGGALCVKNAQELGAALCKLSQDAARARQIAAAKRVTGRFQAASAGTAPVLRALLYHLGQA